MQSESSPARPDTKPKRFFAWSVLNRDLCQLEFFRRVLEEATDKTTPVLEKLKFLSVFSSNLDEFFMVRIAGLHRRLQTGLPARGADQLSPRAQLELIAERTADLVARQAALFADKIRPAVEQSGIKILSWSDLDRAERERLRAYFHGPRGRAVWSSAGAPEA